MAHKKITCKKCGHENTIKDLSTREYIEKTRSLTMAFHLIVERPIQCSKCKSQNIAEPANEFQDWLLKCLDCDHIKLKEKSTIMTGEDVCKIPDGPIEF